MALGNVFISDTDGNIGVSSSSSAEQVCGLLFDISGQSGIELPAAFQGTVVELNTLDDATDNGIVAYSSPTARGTLNGIAYYHIKHFFKFAGGSGRLFVMFADCSKDWDALVDMQNAANGLISNFGIWTEQHLWANQGEGKEYALKLVSDIQDKMQSIADDYFAPAVALLNANTAQIKTTTGTDSNVVLSNIPACNKAKSRYVSVLLCEDNTDEVLDMQASLASCTPVGNVGAALGCLTVANVCESIGHVESFDLSGYITDIAFGFGDSTKVGDALTNITQYDSLRRKQLDAIDTAGYVILRKYAGREGMVYFSCDKTCSDGDYRTIGRNRVMNKARRSVRAALLPYINSPIAVDPTKGTLAASQITMFTNLLTDIFTSMKNAEEISGVGVISIPTSQNILQTDELQMSYSLIPMGTCTTCTVTEGFALSQS